MRLLLWINDDVSLPLPPAGRTVAVMLPFGFGVVVGVFHLYGGLGAWSWRDVLATAALGLATCMVYRQLAAPHQAGKGAGRTIKSYERKTYEDNHKRLEELVQANSKAAQAAAAAVGGDNNGENYTIEQLSEHRSEGDMWMAVEGSVYDVSRFASHHPGGSGFITKYAGMDASKPFRDAGHSPEATAMLQVPGREPQILRLGTLVRDEAAVLSSCYNTTDVEKAAVSQLDAGALGYYRAGAEDDMTTAENERVWGDWLLRPRMFIDVSEVDTSVTVLGSTTLTMPVIAAPTALLKMAHEEGEGGVAKACASSGLCNCLSTTASMSIEDVAGISPESHRWFQLYVYRDLEKTRRLVQRAEAAGYTAIVLTVDLPVLGNRVSLQRIGFKVPSQFKMANMTSESVTADDKSAAQAGVDVKDPGDRRAYIARLYSQNMSLELIKWLGTLTTLPILVKGILRGEDAARAASFSNVRGIIVSNHGGRQLDGAIAPLTALPEVVRWLAPVNDRRVASSLSPVEVFVDGGVRRGRDIVKALALGAKAVLIGRPVIWGLSVGGHQGVSKVFELLRDELKTCMQLSGLQSVEQIDSSFIVRKGTQPGSPEFPGPGEEFPL
eukprot:gene2647-539_t